MATVTKLYTRQEAIQAVVQNRARLEANPTDNASQKEVTPGDRFNGVDWATSVDYLKNGWRAGVAKMKVQANVGVAGAPRYQQVRTRTGTKLDVSGYFQGRPDCLSKMQRQVKPAPVVRIGVDKAVHAGVSTDKMEAVGRNVLLLVDNLRTAGIPAEVWVCQAIGQGGDIWDLRVKVQEAGQPIDISQLAYWVAHPAALRRTMFALEELESAATRNRFGFKNRRGYGFPISNHAKPHFDEWAPSAQRPDYEVQAWVQQVLARRTGGGN